MKYFKKGLITLTAVLLTAAAQAQEVPAKPFSVKGNLPGFHEQGELKLMYFTSKGRKVETLKMKDGAFEFKGELEEPSTATLILMPLSKNGVAIKPDYVHTMNKKFYLEPGETKVTGTDDLFLAQVSGGPVQRDWLILENMQAPIAAKIKKFSESTTSVAPGKESENLERASARKKLWSEMSSLENTFISKYPASFVSWDIVKNRSVINENPDDLYDLFVKLDNKYKKSKEGIQLSESLVIAKKTVIGKLALDFTLSDTTGKAVSLKSFRGKYILIDFWASWCGPCRGENPNVLKAYNQYKEKNFDVVAVSLDNSKAAWVKAIQEDQMPWTQLSDLNGWKSAVALQYAIKAIPQNFLVDPNGIIVAKNLRGEALEKKLNEILNKS